MKRLICCLLSAALLFSLFGCSLQKQRYSATLTDYFDTVTTLVAYENSKEAFDSHLALVKETLERYDRLFDIYHEYEGVNNLCTLNKKAKDAPVAVDAEVLALLKSGKQAYGESGGRLNICFGSVLSLWHEARETALDSPDKAYLPAENVLQAASRHTSPDNLILDEEHGTVYFADSALQLDAGAIAKGYAAEKTAQALEKEQPDFILNVGGNVVTRGSKPGGGSWNIQIENPDVSSGAALETLSLTNLSVVTSGDYQRYFTYRGKNYCHIIDTKTLFPAEYCAGVTVICKDSALADRLSTALFLMPVEEGKRLVEATDGVEAVWVDKEYRVTCSSGFEQYKMR